MRRYQIKWHFNFNTFEVQSASALGIRGKSDEYYPYLFHAYQITIKSIEEKGRYVIIRHGRNSEVKLKMTSEVHKNRVRVRELFNSKPIVNESYEFSSQTSNDKNIWFVINDLGQIEFLKTNQGRFKNHNEFMVYREKMKSKLRRVSDEVYSGSLNEETQLIHLSEKGLSPEAIRIKQCKIKTKRLIANSVRDVA